MEDQVNQLQNALAAVQAAIEGNAQSNLFQLRQFHGLANEDVNDWLSRFETLAKFNNWSTAKRLSALSLSLGCSAKAWYDLQPPETTHDLNSLTKELTARFGTKTLKFLFHET